MDKRYTIKEKVQVFENQTKYEYFKWWDYFKKIIKVDYLADKIANKLIRSDYGYLTFFKELLTNPKVSEII